MRMIGTPVDCGSVGNRSTPAPSEDRAKGRHARPDAAVRFPGGQGGRQVEIVIAGNNSIPGAECLKASTQGSTRSSAPANSNLIGVIA
jgi:hypothetical protein